MTSVSEENPHPTSSHSTGPSVVRVVAVAFLSLLIAILLLLGTEGALRMMGYGHSTAFFNRRTVDGKTALLVNKNFYQQFLTFPVGSFLDIDDLGFQVSPIKPANTFRVIILGSSAAHGCTPDAAYGFGRILELMLRTRFPKCNIEILNAACPALNSHVMRLAAQACATIQPDAYVIYMGNNEFYGPYGPAWMGEQPINLATIHRKNMLNTLRLVQLLGVNKSGEYLPRKEEAKRYFESLFRFPYNAPEKMRMYDFYRANLEDACQAGLDAGANVLLCSLAVNLCDWSPFASRHRANLPTVDKNRFDQLLRTGIEQERAGNIEAALLSFKQAVLIDDTYAEAIYRLGRCQYTQGDYAAAQQSFNRANDYDCLQVRADGRINDTIKTVATEFTKRGLVQVDVAAQLAALAPHGVLDNTFFWDFVHFNFEGNYQVARILFEQLVQLPTLKEQSSQPPTPLSLEECRRRMAFTPAVQLRHAQTLVPAFTFWGVPQENLAWIHDRVATLTKEAAGISAEQTAGAFGEALHINGPGYYYLQRQYVDALLQAKQMQTAVTAATQLEKDFPLRRGAYWRMAQALAATGDVNGACTALQRLTAWYPEDTADVTHKIAAIKAPPTASEK